ncbi:hypothetical protein PM082_008907 [Marasmius tenuissimus]|nr:hypothetical protein PM082_008907 [Marasmius tenuissimus]
MLLAPPIFLSDRRWSRRRRHGPNLKHFSWLRLSRRLRFRSSRNPFWPVTIIAWRRPSIAACLDRPSTT